MNTPPPPSTSFPIKINFQPSRTALKAAKVDYDVTKHGYHIDSGEVLCRHTSTGLVYGWNKPTEEGTRLRKMSSNFIWDSLVIPDRGHRSKEPLEWKIKLQKGEIYDVTLGFVDTQYASTYQGTLNGRKFCTEALLPGQLEELKFIFFPVDAEGWLTLRGSWHTGLNAPRVASTHAR